LILHCACLRSLDVRQDIAMPHGQAVDVTQITAPPPSKRGVQVLVTAPPLAAAARARSRIDFAQRVPSPVAHGLV
jgi:hypothetical protein